MLIIGVDFHPRFQQIAMVDTETGELTECRLEHENGEAKKFYAGLQKPVREGFLPAQQTSHLRNTALNRPSPVGSSLDDLVLARAQGGRS